MAPLDGSAGQVWELQLGDDVAARNWPALDRKLRGEGYSLSVREGDRSIFSSLSPLQDQLFRQLGQSAAWSRDTPMTVQNAGVVMVGVESGDYTVVAVSQPDLPSFLGSQRLPGEAVLLSTLISGGVAVVLIVLLSVLFSRWQIKRMLKPVEALAQAAQRIEQGDFSRPVDYGGRDELTAVCAAFNHMQEHLLAEREKTSAYERARTDLVAGISHDLRTPLH